MIKISIKKEWKKFFLRKSEWNVIVKNALAAGVDFWHDKYAKKHFTAAGAAQYGYDPRSKGYARRKRLEKHHALPLVWSGASRELAKIRNIHATSKSAKAIINAPTLNFMPKIRKGPRKGASAKRTPMREEMTRVTDYELKNMMKAVEMELQAGMDRDHLRLQEDLT